MKGAKMVEEYRKECIDVYNDINCIESPDETPKKIIYPKSVLTAIMAAKTVNELCRVMTTARMRYL